MFAHTVVETKSVRIWAVAFYASDGRPYQCIRDDEKSITEFRNELVREGHPCGPVVALDVPLPKESKR